MDCATPTRAARLLVCVAACLPVLLFGQADGAAAAKPFSLRSLESIKVTPDMLHQEEVKRPDGKLLARFTVFRDAYGREFKHGTMTEWYYNGQKRREAEYLYGIFTGTETRWYENGKVAYQATWDDTNGLRIKEFDKQGKLKRESATSAADYQRTIPAVLPIMKPVEIAADDLHVYTSKGAEGKVLETFTYYVSEYGQKIRHGKDTLYYPNGAKRRETTYSHGLPNGADTWWYANGKLWMQMEQQNGRRVGIMKTFDDQGKLLRQQDFGKAAPARP